MAQKRSVKGAKKRVQNDAENRVENTNQTSPSIAEPVANQGNQGPMNSLKQSLTGKRKAIFEILDDVKKVKPDQWQDPNQVENLAKSFAGKLGINVPEQRIKQFMNAYKDATKNGPNANVDELVKKYSPNMDEKTLKEIKKFVPKSKD